MVQGQPLAQGQKLPQVALSYCYIFLCSTWNETGFSISSYQSGRRRF